MRHEYIYHGLEDDIAVYQDMDGNECYGMDAYTVEKIEKREEEWENMSQAEQSAWYQEYQSNHRLRILILKKPDMLQAKKSNRLHCKTAVLLAL